MRYFTHLASSNAPKNALQRAALTYLKAESNRLIDGENAYVAAIKLTIADLNSRFPRCTPLTPSKTTFDGTIHIYLGHHFTVSFNLYPVKEGGAA